MKRVLISKLSTGLIISGLAALCVVGARATTVSGALTTDNAFFAYVSASDSIVGSLVAQGNNWGNTFTFSNFALTPGQTYYLHIEAINYGGPGAFIGQFTLSDTGFHFSNGSQTLLTDTTHWTEIYNDSNNNPNNQQPWVTPTDGVISLGANGVGPWGTRSGISNSALWIDGSTNGLSICGNCTVDFSAPIFSASAVPEPETLGLFTWAVAALGLYRMRRCSK